MALHDELLARFGPEARDESLVTTLESYMKLYALSVDELYIKWEQFSYHSLDAGVKLDAEGLDSFKGFIQRQIEKANMAQGGAADAAHSTGHGSGVKLPRPLRATGGSSLFGYGSSPRAPNVRRMKLDAMHSDRDSPGPPSSPVGHTSVFSDAGPGFGTSSQANDSTDADKTVETLNAELPIAEGVDFDSEHQVKSIPFYDTKKYKYRTMRQRLLDAADVLDEQIEYFTRAVQKDLGISSAELGDPTIQSQSSIICVGRIVPDNSSDERINMESVSIETSRAAGIGRRIRLNLEGIKEYSLFPGQITAMRGRNANGEFFKVEELLQLPYLNFPVSTAEEIQEAQLALDGGQMKAIVTSGPYTPSNAIDFTHLEEFIQRVNDHIRPHVLIMFGPFLDVTHPLIETGQIPTFPNLKSQPRTLDELFTKIVCPILRKINPRINVVLIPSMRDAISRHTSYPQDSFSRKELQLPKNFKCYANPATFRVNELFFGCSNNDIFKDMKEVPNGPINLSKNRVDRVSEHILEQRRFYPAFPGGAKTRTINGFKEHVSGADLEVPYLGLTEFIGGFIPDIVIIPSELKHFARVVKNVMVINPGAFVRPRGSRGTYAQLSISAPNLEDGMLTTVEGQEDVYLHNAWKRSRVDILSA
ncbi:AaceriADL299Cp [[Ashbya] aceris (nom. inval.)]|nr:AaceriADL299Cp [[Ashbya] aceris (nom. inval.)]